MIENEMAKLEKPDQLRLSSCLVAELREMLLVVGEMFGRPVVAMCSLLGKTRLVSSKVDPGSRPRP